MQDNIFSSKRRKRIYCVFNCRVFAKWTFQHFSNYFLFQWSCLWGASPGRLRRSTSGSISASLVQSIMFKSWKIHSPWWAFQHIIIIILMIIIIIIILGAINIITRWLVNIEWVSFTSELILGDIRLYLSWCCVWLKSWKTWLNVCFGVFCVDIIFCVLVDSVLARLNYDSP